MSRKGIEKITLLLFVLLLSMVGVVVLGAEYFQIAHVEVSGNQDISKEEIIKLSGIQKYENIFKLDKTLVKKRLESNPYIQVEDIGRNYPNGVYICVRERKKKAVIPYLTSNIVIDTQGIVLEIANEKQTYEYPVVKDLHVKSFAKGEQIIAGDSYQFRALLRVLEGIYNQEIEDMVDEIHIQNPDNIYILAEKNIKIKLGQAIDVDNKLKWLKTDEFKQLEPDLLSEWVFDISIPGKAIFSPVLDWGDSYE